jgi:pyridoxamine 5'-phosphate oxidase
VSAPFLEHDADPDPLRQFERWYGEACAAVVTVPEAMAVATATPAGRPSVRMVLLKGFDERGFVFHTGYGSRKGRELALNERAALLFHWQPLGRQVRIEGSAERTGRDESESYFATRAPRSRVAAWVSRQSEPVESREALERRFEEALARFGDDVPLPEEWGGVRVVPDEYEFWQHGEDRLHDRLRYRRDRAGWTIDRLQP